MRPLRRQIPQPLRRDHQIALDPFKERPRRFANRCHLCNPICAAGEGALVRKSSSILHSGESILGPACPGQFDYLSRFRGQGAPGNFSKISAISTHNLTPPGWTGNLSAPEFAGGGIRLHWHEPPQTCSKAGSTSPSSRLSGNPLPRIFPLKARLCLHRLL